MVENNASRRLRDKYVAYWQPDYGDGVELPSRQGVEFIDECEVGLGSKSRLAWM